MKKKIPTFKSDEEAEAFVASADLTDYDLSGAKLGTGEGRGTSPEFSSERVGLAAWLKALRVYQWVKNLLIFVPLLTSFGFADFSKVMDACLAFVAFSFAASATYLVNDLSDIENDRAHPRKRKR